MAGRGRPKKEDTRNIKHMVPMNKDEEAMLDYVYTKFNMMSKAETLRFCVKLAHDALKNSE